MGPSRSRAIAQGLPTFSSRQAVATGVDKLCAMAGIEAHPHTLRHAFAYQVAETGDVRLVQELLGHADVQTSMGYIKRSGVQTMNAMEKAGLLD